MPDNINIPFNIAIQAHITNGATLTWQFPERVDISYFKFNIYTELVPFIPSPGTAAFTTSNTYQNVTSPSGSLSFYVAITSVDITTGDESPQSSLFFV